MNQGQRLQAELQAETIRLNEERMRKLEEATELYKKGFFKEAGILFEEAGACPNPVEGFGKVAMPPMPMPVTEAPPAEPFDVSAVLAAAMPLLLALFDKSQKAGRQARSRDFQRYTFALMAGGHAWVAAAALANEILDAEDRAELGADEDEEGPAPSGEAG